MKALTGLKKHTSKNARSAVYARASTSSSGLHYSLRFPRTKGLGGALHCTHLNYHLASLPDPYPSIPTNINLSLNISPWRSHLLVQVSHNQNRPTCFPEVPSDISLSQPILPNCARLQSPFPPWDSGLLSLFSVHRVEFLGPSSPSVPISVTVSWPLWLWSQVHSKYWCWNDLPFLLFWPWYPFLCIHLLVLFFQILRCVQWCQTATNLYSAVWTMWD